MGKKSYPTSLLLFILIILVFQVVANYFYWYWRIWWFDVPMHFAGGIWVGLSALWFVFLSGRFKGKIPQTTFSVFIIGIFSVLIVAIVWEIFEYIVYIIIPHTTPYSISDTLGDIALGVLGGLTASFAFFKKGYV